MNQHDIGIIRVEMDRLRERTEALERSQGARRAYGYSPETEAVRWRAVCLYRELRRLTGGDE